MQIRTTMALAALLFTSVGAGTAAADRLRTYEATLARLTNIAVGCVELQGVAACRGDMKDVRDVLLTRMTSEQAEAYIRTRITTIPTAAELKGKPCIIPAMLSESVQEKINGQISKLKLQENSIGKEFAVTELNIDLKGTDYRFTPGDKERAEKLAASHAEVAACFPNFKTRMEMLKEEYDRRVNALSSRPAIGSAFPFLGTYGVPDAKWDGCEDARLQREGHYVTFSANSVFAHEASCKLVSWRKVGPEIYDVTEVCGSSKKEIVERFKVNRKSLSYRGKVYRRCDRQV